MHKFAVAALAARYTAKTGRLQVAHQFTNFSRHAGQSAAIARLFPA